MTYLIVQTALLLLAAYLLGALVGCLLRRLFTSAQPARTEAAEIGTAAAATAAAAAVAGVAARQAPDPVQPRIETVAQPTPPEAAVSESVRFERALSSAPRQAAENATAAQNAVAAAATAAPGATEPAPAPVAPVKAMPATPVEAAPAAAAPEARLPSAGGAGGFASTPTSIETPSNPAEAEASRSEAASAASTIATIATGAAAAAAAAVASRSAAAEARNEQPEPSAPAPASSPAPSPVAPVATPVVAAAAPDVPDDLTRIRGIGPEIQTMLAHLGYKTYRSIAAWTPADVAKVEAKIGGRRVSAEGWIEQAQVLAKGGETAHTRRILGHSLPMAGAEVWSLAGLPPSASAAPAAGAADMSQASTDTSSSAAATVAAAAATAAAAVSAVASMASKVEATKAPAMAGAPEAAPAATPMPAPAPAAEAAGPADDLKLIRGIGPYIERLLNSNGVTRYSQIAAWTTADVEKFGAVIGPLGRIPQENWVEQAQVLAKGGKTHHARRMTEGGAEADRWSAQTVYSAVRSAAADAAPATAAAVAASAAAAVAAVSAEPRHTTEKAALADAVAPPARVAEPDDDLLRIRGVDLAAGAILASRGVRRYSQIAKWTSEDVNRFDALLGQKGRISEEGWIEQAQILARGSTTAFAQSGTGAVPLVAKPTAALSPEGGLTPAAATPEAPAAPAVAEADAVANSQPAPAAVADQDDLTRIRGIDRDVARILEANGVSRFAQIAAWSDGEAGRFDGLVGPQGRIAREGWIEQARALATGMSVPADPVREASAAAGGMVAAAVTTATAAAATVASAVSAGPAEAASAETSGEAALKDPEDGGATRPARLVDAIRQNQGRAAPQSPVSANRAQGLRSVRSELLVTPGAPAGRVDDLKRIRGVGVLIEKKLNSLGVHSYQQIANWDASDIDRISQMLDFKGRIERENWVEQARILAAGGQTEFSRRVDRDRS